MEAVSWSEMSAGFWREAAAVAVLDLRLHCTCGIGVNSNLSSCFCQMIVFMCWGNHSGSKPCVGISRGTFVTCMLWCTHAYTYLVENKSTPRIRWLFPYSPFLSYILMHVLFFRQCLKIFVWLISLAKHNYYGVTMQSKLIVACCACCACENCLPLAIARFFVLFLKSDNDYIWPACEPTARLLLL